MQFYPGTVLWTHLKEIPNTKLLVSLFHWGTSANFEVFDISQQEQPKKIYAFEGVKGGISTLSIDLISLSVTETEPGDVTYNSRRNLLGAIPSGGQIAYHLFNIEYNALKSNYSVKLLRKSKWLPQYKVISGKLLTLSNSALKSPFAEIRCLCYWS